ncbi:class I SAM-dependent methyltransferase [Thioclava sp. 15-R06ZXC-3]|uniref:Class I SAM-dependent methyltransferase n=1 Tax=Thioclava arctica TaxID=3238301 RepID=A0ABV3TPZ3_9RHOB
MKQAIRSAYVSVLRGARQVLGSIGFLGWLERREGRGARWFRSLFAIYDIDDLVRLDTPWWTFNAIDTVDQYLAEKPGARVFEWGSGASTVWLAKRAGEVISIEHDGDWADVVAPRIAGFGHVTLTRVDAQAKGRISSGKFGFEGQFFDDYVAAIRDVPGQFDLIVIDGRAREACLDEALARLAPGGRILFDDFKRARYRAAVSGRGLSVQTLDGLAACLPLPDSTALVSYPA